MGAVREKENKKMKEENEYLINKNKELEKELIALKTKIKKNSLMLYQKPTLIGLNNIGATCFMNATLQCLSQTKALTNYFLNEDNKTKIINNNVYLSNSNESQLSPLYYELIHHLWDENNPKPYSPYNFMNKINEMNPLFKLGQAGDSKDFIIFVLEQLHKELKKSVNDKNTNNSKANVPLNQYDQINSFKHFFNSFQENCSIISDIFFGVNQTTNICLNCKQNYNSKNLANPICYNFEIFNCLIFPLEEVRKMKNNSNQNNNMNQINNDIISIYDCFIFNQKNELFTGQNQNYCNICKQTYNSIYNVSLYSCPNVLILILNRGKGNIYNVKLNFYETIDITNYVIIKDKPRIIYNLYGVIIHHGQSGPNAHFLAACKSPIDNKWYRYNDAIVSPIINLQSELFGFGTPYILFYQKQ